jgi:ATP-dependent RNA helicase DDX3X
VSIDQTWVFFIEPAQSQQPPQQQYNDGGRYQNQNMGGRWNDNKRGGDVDYTLLTTRDERVEQELFGNANTGINFNKYEDIPVEG